MKILITGAAGFIGSNLAKRLQKDGHELFGYDNFSTDAKENLDGVKINMISDMYSIKPELISHIGLPSSTPTTGMTGRKSAKP